MRVVINWAFIVPTRIDDMSAQEITRSLDARYYTDPEVFRIEQDGLFTQAWQFAGHASQLEKPGDYFAFEIAGQNLFCIRDRDGEIRAYYNVCQHRAHELVSGSGRAKLIVCPYHAWTYELTGELRSGPNVRAVPGFDRSKVCLTPVRVEDFCGFVFVNLDPDAKPMDDWFPRVREELSAYVPRIARLKPVEWVEIPENCNWKVSVENYSECYHCAINHPTFSSGVINPKTYDIQPQGHCLRHTTECRNLEDMTYPIDLDANAYAGKYSSWFLWPMFSFQVYPGNVLNTYHWRPVDAGHVVVWRGWYAADDADGEIAAKLAVQDRKTTVEEDIRLVESVQRGLKSRGYVPGPLVVDPACGVNSEHSVKILQAWMREAVDGA
jgi:phenylpropionate dioxygenase-like ring-hydroxylating dioxygenase large terminal subunit